MGETCELDWIPGGGTCSGEGQGKSGGLLLGAWVTAHAEALEEMAGARGLCSGQVGLELGADGALTLSS